MKIYAWLYRTVMKVMHHYNWHYAPVIGPFEDGSTQAWCKWCGLRHTYPPPPNYVSYKFTYTIGKNSNFSVRKVNKEDSII